jgi:hypothetical protein
MLNCTYNNDTKVFIEELLIDYNKKIDQSLMLLNLKLYVRKPVKKYLQETGANLKELLEKALKLDKINYS